MSNSSFVLHPTVPLTQRRTIRPTFVYGTLDPVLSRKRPAITPGSVLLTAFTILFGLYATGNLPIADRAFDQFYAFSMQHNDDIVHAIVASFPILLVLWAIGMMTTLILLRINNQRRRQNFADRHRTAKPLTADITSAPPNVSSKFTFLNVLSFPFLSSKIARRSNVRRLSPETSMAPQVESTNLRITDPDIRRQRNTSNRCPTRVVLPAA